MSPYNLGIFGICRAQLAFNFFNFSYYHFIFLSLLSLFIHHRRDVTIFAGIHSLSRMNERLLYRYLQDNE